MKKILFIIALVAAISSSNSFAQNTTSQASGVLASYYNIKDALVAGNAGLAATKADDLKKSLVEQNTLPVSSKNSLINEVSQISASKDIKVQRAAFANLSAVMMTLAKTEKLSTQPVYQLYCPMKKSYWLSNEKVVKNPYYGSSMLTCGKVEGTI